MGALVIYRIVGLPPVAESPATHSKPDGQRPTVQLELEILVANLKAEVEEGAVVEFHSSRAGLNHYIVVIPLRSPDQWVVDGPIRVGQGGFGTGRARFGSGAVGVGENFSLMIVATTVLLPEGVLVGLPADARRSQQVVVHRVK